MGSETKPGMLVLTGVIGPAEADAVNGAAPAIVEAAGRVIADVAALAVTGAVLWKYIQGRTSVKSGG